jgi:hypothetical protein
VFFVGGALITAAPAVVARASVVTAPMIQMIVRRTHV